MASGKAARRPLYTCTLGLLLLARAAGFAGMARTAPIRCDRRLPSAMLMPPEASDVLPGLSAAAALPALVAVVVPTFLVLRAVAQDAARAAPERARSRRFLIRWSAPRAARWESPAGGSYMMVAGEGNAAAFTSLQVRPPARPPDRLERARAHARTCARARRCPALHRCEGASAARAVCNCLGAQPVVRERDLLVFAFVGYLEIDQVLLLWDRVRGFDSLDVLAVAAVAILRFRRDALLAATSEQDVADALDEAASLKIVPLMQDLLARAA